MPTEGTPYGYGRKLRLPDAMRSELRVPLGKLVDAEEFRKEVKGLDSLVTVGDYCTAEALQASAEPKVAVVDLRVKRKADSRLEDYAFRETARVIEVENEPAHISEKVWGALEEAFSCPERVLLQVRGEEDLVALPAIALAPFGYVVAYGLPDRGAVLVRVDSEAKARVEDVLSRMEVLDGD
jgi:uncharacterized protein (UPF0218 family)